MQNKKPGLIPCYQHVSLTGLHRPQKEVAPWIG